MMPEALGLMFATCMVVMLIVQAIAFSPLVKPATTRWLIAPMFAVMGLGLALIPVVAGPDSLFAATGMVAAAGGLLTPVLAYWVSWISGRGASSERAMRRMPASRAFSSRSRVGRAVAVGVREQRRPSSVA